LLDLDLANVDEDPHQGLIREIAKTQQIGVARRTDGFAQPDQKQQRAFQDKPVDIRRTREPVEKTLHRIAREDQIRVHTDCFRVPREPRLHRTGKAVASTVHATSASR
jgi:hypothetical protein